MQTFRLIGMALLAIVMCVNFTSCSDDEEEPTKNDDGIISNQKQLMQTTEEAMRANDGRWRHWYLGLYL